MPRAPVGLGGPEAAGRAGERAGCGRGGRGVQPRSFIENNNSAAGERAGLLCEKASLFLAAVAK